MVIYRWEEIMNNQDILVLNETLLIQTQRQTFPKSINMVWMVGWELPTEGQREQISPTLPALVRLFEQ